MYEQSHFLDRDGVINRETGNYIYNLKDFVINDGLEQALDIWSRDGYSFVIVTNQGGFQKDYIIIMMLKI